MLLGPALLSPAAAQKGDGPPEGQPQRGVRVVSGPRGMVNVRKLAQQEALNPPEPRPLRPKRKHRPDQVETIPPELWDQMPRESGPAAALLPREQPVMPRSPLPALDFQALPDNGTSIPPDTMGTVGPNHLMVALNTQVRFQNRTGATQGATVSLDGFWAGVTPANPNAFDPRIAYDPFNDRWMFTAAADADTGSSSVLIGVTQTADPTGNWFLYRVDADAAGACWFDFPTIGFNKDWIVVTGNMFTVTAQTCAGGVQIYVFNKAAIYAGPPSLTPTVIPGTVTNTRVPVLTYDNTLPVLYLVRRFSGNSGGFGFLGVAKVVGPVGSETVVDLTGPPGFPRVRTPNTWSSGPPGGADFCPQMGTLALIQCNDDRALSGVYRNGSVWLAQTVFLPAGGSPTRTAAQWWQFEPEVNDANGFANVLQFGRVDDSSGVNFFAYPSIAVNSRNDALMGYSVFSASAFASAAYSFRSASDPPGAMQSSVTYKAGLGTYVKTFGGPDNRWGDYSSTVVDPANDLDFWTVQEFAALPSPGSLWGTWWAKVNAPAAAKKRQGQVITQPLLLFLLW